VTADGPQTEDDLRMDLRRAKVQYSVGYHDFVQNAAAGTDHSPQAFLADPAGARLHAIVEAAAGALQERRARAAGQAA
jgi:hypothetical protein